MLKKSVLIVAILIFFSFVITGCGGQQAEETENTNNSNEKTVIKLKMADSFPTNHLISKGVAVYFKDRVEELTEGRVEIEYYPAEQLGKLNDLLDLCSQGATDISYIPTSFLTGKLPLNSVIILPFWTTAQEGSSIYWEMVNGILAEEYKKYNIKPIFICMTAQYDIGTTKKPIRSLDDLKGLTLKSSGGIYEKIHRLAGANPVSISPNELYEGMQRGIVEGAFLSFYSVDGYRLNELEKYHTYGASFGGYPNVYAINEDTWQSLPEDIQNAILQAGEDTVKHGAGVIDESQETFAKKFEEEGMEIYRLTPEEQKQWREKVMPIKDIWIKDMEEKGLDGKAVFDEFERLCNKYVK